MPRPKPPRLRPAFRRKPANPVSDLFRKELWPIVFIGIVVAVFSQAVGQNSLFSYAPELFRQAGMAQDSAFLQSIIIGVINFIFTFIAIGTIDKVGRKKLLQYGSALLCLDALALSGAFYWQLPGAWVLVFVLAFIAIYSATLRAGYLGGAVGDLSESDSGQCPGAGNTGPVDYQLLHHGFVPGHETVLGPAADVRLSRHFVFCLLSVRSATYAGNERANHWKRSNEN